MTDFILSTILALLSSVGFSIIANVPKRALLGAGITGVCSWMVYYVLDSVHHSIVLPNFMASFVVGMLGFFLARRFRVPVTMIYVGALISLVPGGMAFSTLQKLSENNLTAVLKGLFNTGSVAMSLALGVGVANIFNGWLYQKKMWLRK